MCRNILKIKAKVKRFFFLIFGVCVRRLGKLKCKEKTEEMFADDMYPCIFPDVIMNLEYSNASKWMK